MPSKGARTIVCESWRAASSRAGQRILIARMILDRRIGIAVEIRGDAGQLLLQRGELLLRRLKRVARRIERCLAPCNC